MKGAPILGIAGWTCRG